MRIDKNGSQINSGDLIKLENVLVEYDNGEIKLENILAYIILLSEKNELNPADTFIFDGRKSFPSSELIRSEIIKRKV